MKLASLLVLTLLATWASAAAAADPIQPPAQFPAGLDNINPLDCWGSGPGTDPDVGNWTTWLGNYTGCYAQKVNGTVGCVTIGSQQFCPAPYFGMSHGPGLVGLVGPRPGGGIDFFVPLPGTRYNETEPNSHYQFCVGGTDCI